MNTESKPELTNKEIGYFYNLVCHALMDVYDTEYCRFRLIDIIEKLETLRFEAQKPL